MMSEPVPHPQECRSLDEVSGGLEAIDRLILELLAQRFALIRQQAQTPQGLADLHNDDHRQQAIAGARRAAFELGVPVGLVVEFWDRLCDASLATGRQAAKGSL